MSSNTESISMKWRHHGEDDEDGEEEADKSDGDFHNNDYKNKLNRWLLDNNV